MKANELRIGNYYQYAGNSGIVTTSLKGIKINEFGFYSDLDGTNLEICKPIPLTEEILLKCGLKRTLYDSSYELKDFSIFLDKRIRENIYIQCEKRNWNVLNGLRIDYLHQLQNLYFALTNEELTVNL